MLDSEVQEVASPIQHQERAPHDLAPAGDSAQELQVRRTAQRILAGHLQLLEGTSSEEAIEAQRRQPSPDQDFWPGISLDLTGAALIDFDFRRVSVLQGWFNHATFHGNAEFDYATFYGNAIFSYATFQGNANFGEATFHGNAVFHHATIHGYSTFEATFHGHSSFSDVTFQETATFQEAIFQGRAGFYDATFKDSTWFLKAAFESTAGFTRATFRGGAAFSWATFQGDAQFDNATFQGDARFGNATFQGGARFDRAAFTSKGGTAAVRARVLHVDNPSLNQRRVWPDGWTVHTNPADPTSGMLLPAEQTEKPAPAVLPPDETRR